jgi:hypothetical protein
LPNEHVLRASVALRLKKLALADPTWWWLKVVGNMYQRPNVPDFLLLHAGRFGAMELKQEGEHPTIGQKYEMGCLERAGALVAVVRSMAEVEAHLDRLR